MGIFDGFRQLLKGNGRERNEDNIVSPLLIRPIDTPAPMGASDVAKMPLLPMHFRFMYDIYYYSDVLRTVVRALVWEIFRNGIAIKSKFAVKCIVCGTEYLEYVERCEVCGSEKLREPVFREKMFLEKIIADANLNDQSLLDVLSDVATDIAVTDNGFLVVVKRYEFDEDGNVIMAEPVEIVRGSPLKMRLIMNKNGRLGMTDDDQVVAICLRHRDKYILCRQEEMENLRCPDCGLKMYPAYYKLDAGGGNSIYYTDGEVLHFKVFTTGVGYGMSPILSVWIKIMILMKMDWFVLQAYHLQRPPKGLLILRGNRDSVIKAWEWLTEQARINPHMISPLVVEGSEGASAKRVAEFIDLTVRSNDIDFIAYREELRKAIGAVYSVMPLWQGDMRGGLANEGLQITVTNRTIEVWHRVFNEKVFPWLARQLGVSDWKLELRPHEMRDEMSKLEIAIRKTQLAQALRGLGYKAVLRQTESGEIDFKYEEREVMEELRDLLEEIVHGTGARINADELLGVIMAKLQENESKEGEKEQVAEGLGSEGEETGTESGGDEVVGVVGEGGELENIPSQELARPEGEPERARPKRIEQRFEGEPQIPRR